ncbi:gp58-like family protein [Limosilactobacillus reuteri]|uniref:gp58-like family protein n=1 Tax=Limosilactobacillus reuteri TaxID=1598 RepID=UPI001E4B7377|nr:gp58-like family protein [Limosilactobacillus reuteri]MCC4487353.1 peptidase [Limosilactobacillus reuteri]
MLTQSKETRDAWRASQRTLDIKVTIDGKTYGATDINSLKYDSGAYNGDTFAIGSTYSNTVQIEFSHLIEGLKLGMEVHPSIGIKTSSGYVYEPLGVFIISSEIKMDRNNNLTTVSASDRFCGLEGTYVSKLTYPAKVLDVIAEICAQSGVKANTDDLARLPHQADLSAPITGQSYRKALGWIAQLYVGYALFDRQGLFTIRTISEPNYELDPSQYEQAGLTKNEAAYKINGIQCQVTITTKTRDGESTEETKNYQAGDATGSQIKLENNIMTPQRLNDIWEQLKDITFYPFSLNWFGNPAVEAGDWLRLEDKQGNSFVVPNSSYTLDFNGGLSATSKADQTTSSDQMVPWQGSVAQTIKELKIRRSPDGTVVFPPNVTAPPTNAKFNDVWFKKNGNSTELWIFEKQDDGSGKWIRKDLSDDEIKKKVADARQGLNQAKADIINNKQKADADIENLNKSIEDNKKVADQDIQNLNKSIEANKKVADESLQKLNDSVTNLQGQYDNNIVPNLNKVIADASDALQKYITAQSSIADLTKRAQQQGKDIADVSNTVKGLNINYANLAGDVNSIKVDVKGLQTIVGTANGDIAQLKLDAQNLQTMLAGKVDNTTYTNFVNLTNQALNARLTASDLNGYAKTADVQATANGLRVDLNSVTDRMNNLKVGTSNLLHHSDTFEGWHKGASVSVSSNKYLSGNIAVLKNTGSGGTALDADLDGPYDNQPISWAVYAKADNAGDKLHTELWGGGGLTEQPLTTEWQVYKFTGQRDARDHSLYLWGCQGNKGNIYIALPFAVVGDAIGTWGPNASDIDHDLNELSARINVTNQQFSSYYTKLETDTKTDTAKNDAINAIKSDANWTGLTNIITNSGFLQTADGFIQKVQQTAQPLIDANNGGGINLLKKTDFANETIAGLQKVWGQQFTLRDGKAMQLDALNISKGIADAVQLVPVDPDTDYTLSFEAFFNTVATGGNWNAIQTFMVERKNATENTATYVDHARTIVNTDKRKDNIYTIHTQKDCHYLQVIFRANAKTLISFTRPKLEKGRVSTPYSPAPSDNVTQLAFTELTQTVNGLQSTVSNNYTGLQTQINQTAAAIRSELTDSTSGLQNQITATANGLDLTIKNLVVGGGNLLHNSDTFDGWSINGTVKIDDSMYLNGKIAVLTPGNGTSNELLASSFDGPLTDETATWVIYAKADNAGDKLHTELFGGGGLTNQSLTTEWQKYKFTGHRDKRLKQLHFWGLAENQGNIYIALPILSEGSVEKTWEPNPADMATRKDFASLNVTLQGLQSTVSSNYGTLQSQISQSSTAIRTELTDKIKGIDNKTTSTADSLNSVIGRVGSLENLTNFQVINNAINANDYTNTGNYFIQSTANTNVPGTNWCYLKVERVNDGRIVQTWQADIDPTLRYVRTKFGDLWTQWQRSASYSEYSELNRTVQGLQSTVSNNHGELQSQISQTAKTIRQEVSDKTNGLQTQINQQGNNFNVSLNSLRKETAWQKVTSAIDANNYKTTGNYWIQAAPNSNTPDSSAWAYFQVVAYSDAKRIKQTWQRDNNENDIYTRLLIGDNWTSWQRIVTGGNIMAQINMSAGATLIQNDKIYMDASSTIFSGKAFIPDAAITNISADKITTGTLDAGRINVVNLNANNITTGTINGQNLRISLDTGEILFNRGKIASTSGALNIDIDNARMSVTNSFNSGFYFSNGRLDLTSGWSPADNDFKYGSVQLGDGNNINFLGMAVVGNQGLYLRTKDYDGGLYGLDPANNGSEIALQNGGRGAIIQSAGAVTILGGSTHKVLWDEQPFISIGKDQDGNRGNRIYMDADYIHISSAWRHTTGDAPNLFIANDGALVRSTSASKYKTEIQRDYSTDYGDRLLELPTATWIDKGQKERYQAGKRSIKPKKYFGMIAEDLADAGLDLLVSKNADGEIEGIQYERIAPALIPVIRKLKKKVQQLEEKLNE